MLDELLDLVLSRRRQRLEIQIVQNHDLIISQRAVRRIGRAIDVKLSRRESLDQVRLGARGVLRDIENLGTAQSEGAIESNITEAVGSDQSSEAQGAGSSQAGMNSNLVVALLEPHWI